MTEILLHTKYSLIYTGYALGARFNIMIPVISIPIIKIKRSWNRLISVMGIHISVRGHLHDRDLGVTMNNGSYAIRFPVFIRERVSFVDQISKQHLNKISGATHQIGEKNLVIVSDNKFHRVLVQKCI